jgi:prominin 1
MIGSASVAILLLVATVCAAKSPSIPFSPIPTVPEPASTSRDTSHGLAGFYSLARGVVDTIRPGNLPHDTVGDLAATVSDHVGLDWGIPPSDTDTRALVNEFLRWLAPAIAAMVLGVLLAVLVPVVGCCTLCCRACGRCGAKSRIYRKKNQNVKCLILTSIFLVTTSMIFVGATIGAVSAKHVTESLGELESTVNTALTDVGNYLDGGAQQVFFVADDQFGVFEAHVLNDINHIGEWFESSIGSDFQSKALTVINQASSLLSKLREIDAVVVSGNTLVGELRSTTQALISQISTLRGDMETLRVACLADGLGGVCDSLSSTHFAVTVNFTNIEDIEFNEDVNFTSIEEGIDIAKDMFQNMAEFIDSEAKDYGLSQKAEEEFSSTHSTLKYDYLNAVNETIQNIVSSGGHIDNARDEVHDALKYLDKYEAVWNGVGILLVCLFFLIVVVFVVGLFCGSFGYSREAQPNSRSSVSNCGGRCILG